MFERQIGAVISVFTLTIYWIPGLPCQGKAIPAVIAWHDVPWYISHTRRGKKVYLTPKCWPNLLFP